MKIVEKVVSVEMVTVFVVSHKQGLIEEEEDNLKF
jgi:hypothetical protein